MKQRITIVFTFLALSIFSVKAQQYYSKVIRNGKLCTLVPAVIENGDTIAYMSLPEVIIYADRPFANEKEKQKWNKLKRDVKKAYPYAILASIKLKEYNAKLLNMKTEVERKAYMKKAEKELKKQFEKDLKNLTLSQGRILIRLIDRETGSTSYSLVKDLRGSFSAFCWQTVAAVFNSSLKAEYDPTKGEDKMIEQIIGLIESGLI
jgi:hypothetical protein